MGQVFARMLRKDRLPFLALGIALLRARNVHPRDGSILSMLAGMFSGKSFTERVVGDVIGVYLAVALYRKLQEFNRSFRSISDGEALVKTVKDSVGNKALDVLKKIPMANEKIQEEFAKIEKDLEKSLKVEGREQFFELPSDGIEKETLIKKLQANFVKEKPMWHDGFVSGAVYGGSDESVELQSEAFKLYALTNPLHPDIWPSVCQMEAEIISMTANILGKKECPTVCGTLTSGGTESILMAAKTHREWAFREKGIDTPEIVAPVTAHAGIDKACEILGIKLVHVPVDKKTAKVKPSVLKKYITSDTIMIYSSAPHFPHGIIDPIEELSEIAVKYGVGLHVDCCLGGFVLPFARKLGYPIPKFHFELPGVTSISVDTHKYAYAAKGTSVVLYRSPEVRRYQYFAYPSWPGGLYVTPSTAGSRPGALSAACWTSMMSLGEKGYLDATKQIMETQRKIKAETANIPGLYIVGDPIAMIVAWASDKFNIYTLADRMHKRGWSLNSLQRPASIHLCVTLRTVHSCDKFISDLREVAEECMSDPKAGQTEGDAAVYGMSGSMPQGPVDQMLRTYTDVVLKV